MNDVDCMVTIDFGRGDPNPKPFECNDENLHFVKNPGKLREITGLIC